MEDIQKNQGSNLSLNEVLSEYAEYRKECDEICKEYEETIQILSDSVEHLKSENSKLNEENDKMKNDNEKLTKELEKAREKNKEKIKDIEILNNKLDELQFQFKEKGQNEKNLKSKVVNLENDNDHYVNRIHQYEEEVADLKDNLENATENLIIAQKDFQDYKVEKEEELERLKLQLQEEKNNVKALLNKKLIPKKIQVSKPNEEFEDNFKNKEEIIEFCGEDHSQKEKSMLRGKRPKRKNEKQISQNENYQNSCNALSQLKKRREKISIFKSKIKQ